MNELESDKNILQLEFRDIKIRRLNSDTDGQVLIDLVEKIAQSSKIKQAAWPTEEEEKGRPPNLIGLALSGGGIRSATFSLGVLQYLGKRGHFPRFDYLSTVSGGGFLGSCLTSWYTAFTQREQTPPFPFVHETDRVESVPFQHLRNFSNYLAPKGDVLDNMRMLALFIRGVMINLVLVLPFFLIAAYLAAEPMRSMESAFIMTQYGSWIVAIIFLLSTLIFSCCYKLINWKDRNWGTRFLGFLLLVLGGCFFLELQPLMLRYFHQLHVYLDEQSGLALGFTGGLSTLAYFFMNLFKQTKETQNGSAWGKYLLAGLLVVLVPLFFWGLFLFLVHRGLVWSGCDPLLAQATLNVDILNGYGVAGGLLFVLGMCFNINKYSLHVFYRDRLSRAYLIQPPSQGDWQTQRPEMNDQLKLGDLRFEQAPYHLINAAVNVTCTDDKIDTPDDFVNRGRTADFFLFSKHWVGSELTGYCPTSEMEQADPWLNLGTAMAISGAAFSPNMGTFTIKPLTALMTFFNIRLGYWLPNPACFDQTITFDGTEQQKTKHVKRGATDQEFFKLAKQSWWHPPRKYLFNEALSSLSVKDDAFINVSDGGHIENLGIYPLLQRRCRLIIALDGEADKNYFFEGLAATIRLARINLNIHIDMDQTHLDGISQHKQHYAIGSIHYKNHQCIGTLLYIKSSWCGHEDIVIQHFKDTHPDFPHESTMDQFFDEEQFEAYRALGHHVARQVFEATPASVISPPDWALHDAS